MSVGALDGVADHVDQWVSQALGGDHQVLGAGACGVD